MPTDASHIQQSSTWSRRELGLVLSFLQSEILLRMC